MPVVSPNPISVAPISANRSARPSTRSSGTFPSYGQPKEVAITASSFSPSARMRFAIPRSSAIVCSTSRLMFLRLWVSDALTKIDASWNRSRTWSALSRPRLFGMSTIRLTWSGTSMRFSTSTPSESCGITSGRTKLATSMRRKPLCPSRLTRRTFSSVGITSGSFWNPSRGPTSRMSTLPGLVMPSTPSFVRPLGRGPRGIRVRRSPPVVVPAPRARPRAGRRCRAR